MTAEASQMLDELMGRNRNVSPDKKKKPKFSDPEMCKNFLAKFCFNELFLNTKVYMGPCMKHHDEKLKKEYEESSRRYKMGYEDDFIRDCSRLQGDCERKIQRAKERLANNNRETIKPQTTEDGEESGAPKTKQDECDALTEQINNLINKAEQLGCQGDVDEAQNVMRECDKLKEKKHKLFQHTRIPHPMEVCETCGALLVIEESHLASQRMEDHLKGKQHIGFFTIKNVIVEMKELMKVQSEKNNTSNNSRREYNSNMHQDRERNDRSYRERSPYDRRDHNSSRQHSSNHHHSSSRHSYSSSSRHNSSNRHNPYRR